ncbi:MAG: polyprenyl synthetase family protein [Bacteroidetes bacterium]|nr:polyprenyl synthetase family protein [Bacteroidota bacterium]
MHDPAFFQDIMDSELKKIQLHDTPTELYDPIRYMLALGGKRLRPSLVLMGTELFGGHYMEAISPALGIEVFHNFTLMHDDIMDKAPLRRSQPTVHTKWNQEIAILSGDTMFVKSCELMMQVKDDVLRNVMSLFYKTAVEVCEGQQLDMNYETKTQATLEEYIHMITLKTAVLVGCSLKTGAIIAGADEHDRDHLYEFGKNIGVAFQLHDDILDVYGDEQKFGKQTGGDIIANKKTFLLLKALEVAGTEELKELKRWLAMKEFDKRKKVEAVKDIFSSLHVRSAAEKKMDEHFQLAIQSLNRVNVSEERKMALRIFSEKLMVREC